MGNARVFFSDRDGNGSIEVSKVGGYNEVLQQEHYYPFGMGIRGEWKFVQPQIGGVNLYQYNGKELNEDFGLNWNDYGARWYDASTGRWGGVDPLAEKYSSWSGYNYVMGNPLKFVDPDGMRVEGDYYSANGVHLGSDGKKDNKVYVAESVTKNDKGLVTGATGKQLLNDLDGNPISITTFKRYAATIINEDSRGSEVTKALGSAMYNYSEMKGWNISDYVVSNKAHASNQFESSEPIKNKQLGFAAAINALTGGIDYSNGSTDWDGFDFAAMPFKHDKAKSGYILHSNHLKSFGNIWSDEQIRIVSGGSFNKRHFMFNTELYRKQGFRMLGYRGSNSGRYRYESRAVLGRTIFWRRINVDVMGPIKDRIKTWYNGVNKK